MALSAEQLAVIRQLGGMLLGGAGRAMPGAGGAITGGPYGVGKAAREGGRVWNTITRENPEGYKPDHDASTVLAATTLADQMRSEPIDFDAGIVYVPGTPQNNALLVRTPENLAAFLRQTDAEHRAALEKYQKEPWAKQNPDRAIRLGIREEENLPKWWNDKDPRLPVTPSSSCVSSAKIGPNGDIYIRFRDGGKEYQYEGSSDPVEASRILQDLVTAPSIGKAVNSWTGFWGKNHTYLPK